VVAAENVVNQLEGAANNVIGGKRENSGVSRITVHLIGRRDSILALIG